MNTTLIILGALTTAIGFIMKYIIKPISPTNCGSNIWCIITNWNQIVEADITNGIIAMLELFGLFLLIAGLLMLGLGVIL